jgi:hypothetical protein
LALITSAPSKRIALLISELEPSRAFSSFLGLGSARVGSRAFSKKLGSNVNQNPEKMEENAEKVEHKKII